MSFASAQARLLRTSSDLRALKEWELKRHPGDGEQPSPATPESENKSADLDYRHLVGEVAHHLNNFLAVLFGELEILRERRTLKEAELRQVRTIIKAAERQQEFIQRLMWSAGIGFYLWKAAALQSLVNAAFERVQDRIGSKIGMRLVLPSDDFSIFCSPVALEQAIFEVLKNSISAIDEVGHIEVNCCYEFLSDVSDFGEKAEPGWYYRIRVDDNGSGIEPDLLPRVARPFVSGHVERDGPTGLGFAVAMGVARSHGGGLRIESTKGVGTSVSIYIPPADSRHNAEEAGRGFILQEDGDGRDLVMRVVAKERQLDPRLFGLL